MSPKTVVITGGSTGLGKELAKKFIERGENVIICARDEHKLHDAAQEIGATPFVADVTKDNDLQNLAEFTLSTFGTLDIWINNAGVWLPETPVEELDISRVEKMYDINVFGTMRGVQAALPLMKKQGTGTIINIVSTSALMARPFLSGYSSSKWAVRGFTDGVREECKGSGVSIIGIYPGGMNTDLFNEQRPENIGEFMSAESVAQKILENLKLESPVEELILKRPEG